MIDHFINDEFVYNLIMFQTLLYVDVWDSPADEDGINIHLIDKFTIAIPQAVSNCVDESNSLTVHGQLGIGNLTLAFFNLTTNPITSCSSADVPTFSTSSQSDNGKSCIIANSYRLVECKYTMYICTMSSHNFKGAANGVLCVLQRMSRDILCNIYFAPEISRDI